MGKMMALATRYEVSAQVASSGVEESEPAIWGSETLTTVVSSSSMNVLVITVIATIQGLTSGMLLFVFSGLIGVIVLCPLLFVRQYRGHDRHSRPQDMLRVLSLFKANLYRDPLHDLHIIAGGIFRQKQAGLTCSGSAEVIHVPVVVPVVGIFMDRHRLAHAHVLNLVLLIVGDHPDIIQRHQRHQRLRGLYYLTYLDLLVGDHSTHGRANCGVLQIKFCLLECRSTGLHQPFGRTGVGPRNQYLIGRSTRSCYLGLGSARVPWGPLRSRLGCIHGSARGFFIGDRGIELLLGNFIARNEQLLALPWMQPRREWWWPKATCAKPRPR